MNRQRKIHLLKTYRPHVYRKLLKVVPDLISNPNNAHSEDIRIYNKLIDEESKRDNDNVAFKTRFSF